MTSIVSTKNVLHDASSPVPKTDVDLMDEKVATVMGVTQCTKDEAVSVLFFHRGSVEQTVQTIMDQRQQPSIVEIARFPLEQDTKKKPALKRDPQETLILTLETQVNTLKKRTEELKNRLQHIQTETDQLPDYETDQQQFVKEFDRFRLSTIPVLCDTQTPAVSPTVFSTSPGFDCLNDSDDEDCLLKFSHLKV
jgi:hypothetical protein